MPNIINIQGEIVESLTDAQCNFRMWLNDIYSNHLLSSTTYGILYDLNDMLKDNKQLIYQMQDIVQKYI